ncbi:MAG: glycosyltransferase family 1 protein [Chloroflexi bacterium]|nr:MAG: glycosyltransferase family 1 protein [Chloroflexota bacterium]
MRVAYICADPGVPVFGCKGASVHVQEVIRALVRRGARVELFAMRIGGDVPAGFEEIPIHPLPPIPKGDQGAREQVALAANASLRAALMREGPFDLVYERYSLWSFAGMAYARATGVPGLLEVNAPLIEEQARHRELVHLVDAERVASMAFGAASALLAVSRQVADYLEGHPAARGRVHIVPNGVDPQRFRPGVVPALPGCPGTFTVGFAGSLKPWHGLDILVEAFSLLRRRDPGVRLLVVGDGPMREQMVADLSINGVIDAVHFAGAVAPDEVPAWLASMDVAVAPYPDLEDFYFSPLKMYEYMAAGVPVVASRVGQIAELIEDGVNGVLVPPGDAGALVNALAWLRADASLRARLGPAGRATVLRDHTWDAVAERILALAGFELIPARKSEVPDGTF